MHLHFLGISGTFMSGLALLARAAGYHVTGCDVQCYPPISDLLTREGISWTEGYAVCNNFLQSDVVIVGNAMKRGMPIIEELLNMRKPYMSGPQWLATNILPRYKVLAVAGTHGKTTTTSMLSFILQYAGLQPGFLIGGVAPNFNTSNCLGSGEWFVIEADEYDSAFFDKRPKFMHYRPEVAIINNLEFDHADIYADLAAIQQQFHYLLRTIPASGLIIKPSQDATIDQVIKLGCWTPQQTIGKRGDWCAVLLDDACSAFQVLYCGAHVATINWSLIGYFNVENALAAIAASFYAGVEPSVAALALEHFLPVQRRLEMKYNVRGITVYDDFAHHPTAIYKTIQALRQSMRHKRIFVFVEFASYTMRTGKHATKFATALSEADAAYLLTPVLVESNLTKTADVFNIKPASQDTIQSSLDDVSKQWLFPYTIANNIQSLIEALLLQELGDGDAILVMSNKSVVHLHQSLNHALLCC